MNKAILVMTSDNPFYIDELKSLCIACDIEVEDVVIQKLEKINPATYIGKGKIEEIRLRLDGEMVIFDDELSPLQVKNLTDQLQTEVTDRTDLILRIFEQRAQTKEAKLQVEIARDQYLLPRLAGMQEHMSHQQGGSGFRGSGEKQIELDRRIISRKLSRSRKELAQIVKQRQTQRERRKRNNVPVIALVGYTNSGKSTLLNTLCQNKEKKVFEKDMLFATLQTSTRNIKIKNHTCLLTDTVGFIERLPHNLIQAFRSTLEEVKEALKAEHTSEEITALTEKLDTASKKLVRRGNTAELDLLLAQAKNTDSKLYTQKSYKNLLEVIKAIEEELENKEELTQEEVDALTKKLSDAMAQLEKNPEITPETPSKPSTPSTPSKPSKPSKPGTGTETTKPNKKPQTGDSTMLGFAAFFTMISLLGYVLLKKKEA